MDANLQEMRRRVSYGMPLTIDEQRWLVEQVTGEKITRLKRCYACHATGLVESPCGDAGEKATQKCQSCQGVGFVSRDVPPRPA